VGASGSLSHFIYLVANLDEVSLAAIHAVNKLGGNRSVDRPEAVTLLRSGVGFAGIVRWIITDWISTNRSAEFR